MPSDVALLIGAVFILFAFRSNRGRDVEDTSGLFWPTLWYFVVASRPLGFWLQTFGVPIPGGSDDPTDGSLVDRCFFALLTVIGLNILSRRGFKWGEFLRFNPWLTTFTAYMAVSMLWSHYPYVSFKRYIKVIGSIVMAVVVLTGDRPLESICTVLRRCLYIHLPMSIICIRYFRDIGVSFDFGGTHETWNGIATAKNTLGEVVTIGVLYFSMEIWRHWRESGWKNLNSLYLLMALYLLKGSENAVSMTSVSVTILALLIYFGMQSLRSRPASARRLARSLFMAVALLVVLVVIHGIVLFSANSILGEMITLFGRDITLTDRTHIWHDVYAAAAGNPLFGVGFGGFWIGRMANIPWNAPMTWVLGQGHSGYVDTYLQLGLVGWFLLAVVLWTSLQRLLESLEEDFDFCSFRFTLFLIIVYINITESIYLRGDHNLWFLLQVAIWRLPSARSVNGTGSLEGDADLSYPTPSEFVPMPESP